MKRLDYIDGLKGFCALFVCVMHFWMTFSLNGYLGWRCLPEAAEQPIAYYLEWFPRSVLLNSGFPLYLFFAIISFIICYFFLKNKDEEKMKQNIIMRYFRFQPMVLIVCLVAYLLLAFKFCPFGEYYEITGNTWCYARLEETYSFFDALRIGLVSAFFEGTQLVSVFWCLHYIFLGSVMTYIVMLIYKRLNNKKIFFIILCLLLFFVDQVYLSFAAGIIAAIIADKEYALKKPIGALLVLGGVVLAAFPPVFLPAFINVVTLYAIGTALLLVGVHCCFGESRLLCNRFMAFVGKESLGAIAWQMLVLQSLNLFLFNYLHKTGMGNLENIAINFVVNAVASSVVIWISSKTITPLTSYICKHMRALLWKS